MFEFMNHINPPDLHPDGGTILTSIQSKDLSWLEQAGVSFPKTGGERLDGWMRFSEDITPHTDCTGNIFLMCFDGFGVLSVQDYKPINISTGFFTTFNDHHTHSFETFSETVTLLVCRFKSLSNEIYYDPYFIQKKKVK